ncbi:MAG TPA: MerR family transcriptional regulator [Actinophytocola sp.]|jgi:protein phosphatase|nr:MerR family transcriptional regulator [Actinophytocola sp.]
MELLTIGAFARASRLSPKALRLYDELGLLRPARVDPVSGYRLYEPAQLERARLVAWLRRLGLPLARIKEVCDLPRSAAAEVVADYWRQVETETAARRDLADFLVVYLSREDVEMPETQSPLGIRYAVRTDRGLVRTANQDRAYAGRRVLAVADGYGSNGSGAAAGEVAIEALRGVDVPAGDLLNVMSEAARRAGDAVRDLMAADPDPDGGTTLTALLWSGSQLGLVHIGDSRAYLLRGDELLRITHDHTIAQAMVDEGRLTEDELATHPMRMMLLHALGGGEPDMRLQDVQAGDRYLLCSDGLHRVLDDDTLRSVLTTVPEPEDAVGRLVELANEGGGPDNVSCVVADIEAR